MESDTCQRTVSPALMVLFNQCIVLLLEVDYTWYFSLFYMWNWGYLQLAPSERPDMIWMYCTLVTRSLSSVEDLFGFILTSNLTIQSYLDHFGDFHGLPYLFLKLNPISVVSYWSSCFPPIRDPWHRSTVTPTFPGVRWHRSWEWWHWKFHGTSSLRPLWPKTRDGCAGTTWRGSRDESLWKLLLYIFENTRVCSKIENGSLAYQGSVVDLNLIAAVCKAASAILIGRCPRCGPQLKWWWSWCG